MLLKNDENVKTKSRLKIDHCVLVVVLNILLPNVLTDMDTCVKPSGHISLVTFVALIERALVFPLISAQ